MWYVVDLKEWNGVPLPAYEINIGQHSLISGSGFCGPRMFLFLRITAHVANCGGARPGSPEFCTETQEKG
jgi:hypothetical protein